MVHSLRFHPPAARGWRHPVWLRGGLFAAVVGASLRGWLAADSGPLWSPFLDLAAPLALASGLALLRPRWSGARVAGATLALALGYELSQLWHPHALEVVRGTLPGFWLLGGAFDWADLGAAAAAAVLVGGLLEAAGRALAPPRRIPLALDHPRPWGVVSRS